MGKSSPPAPPDPTATAAAQSGSNVATAAAQAALNNVDQNTPYGSTNFNVNGFYTAPDGSKVPTYQENTALTPNAQNLLTGTQEIQSNLLFPNAWNLAGQAGQAANVPLNFNTAFDPYINPSNLTAQNPATAGVLNQGPQLLDQNVTNAIYGQEQSFLDPQWNLQGTQLQDQLSRQGIPVGSDAYNNAMQQENNAKTQAYQSAQDTAIGQGSQSASNLYNMALGGQGQYTGQQQAAFTAGLQGQQQDIAQQQLAQSTPLSLLSQMFGSTPQTPQQPISTPTASSVAPTDVIGAQGLSTSAQQAQYQAQLQQQNALYGGVASLAGTAALAVAL